MHVSVSMTPSRLNASIVRRSSSSPAAGCLSTLAFAKSVPRGSVIVGTSMRALSRPSDSSQRTPASPRLSVSAMMCACVTGTKSCAPKKSPTLIWCSIAARRAGPFSPASMARSRSFSFMPLYTSIGGSDEDHRAHHSCDLGHPRRIARPCAAVARESGAFPRAFPAGRLDRRGGARGGRQAHARTRPAVRGREPRRRVGRDRHRGSGARRARRLHDSLRGGSSGHTAPCDEGRAIRRATRFHPGDSGHYSAARRRGASFSRRAKHRGPCRSGEGESGQVLVRALGLGHRAAPDGRALQEARRHRDAAGAVQGRRPGGPGSRRRPDSGRRPRLHAAHSAPQSRPHHHPGVYQHGAVPGAAGCSDPSRGGLCGRYRPMARSSRAARHEPGDRQRALRGNAQSAAAGGREEPPARRGIARRRQHAGRIRRAHPIGNRNLDAACRRRGRQTAMSRKQPNFLVILIDDLRYDEFGAGGHPYMKTPHIDRIAHEGALFERAFHTTPICSPNRASILTGQYASRHGIIDNVARDAMSHRLPNYHLELQKLGYETAHIGKWHMGNSGIPRPGYDHWISYDGHGRLQDPKLNVNGSYEQRPGYITDLLNGSAVEFLERRRAKPFALFLAHKAVHPDAFQAADGTLDLQNQGGYLPAERHRDLYRDCVFPPLPNMLPPAKVVKQKPVWSEPFQLKQSEQSRKLLESIHAGTQEEIRLRAAMMASVDEGVGMIFDALERTGQLERTLVLFLGDNGYFFGEHGLGPERRFAYEAGIRSPFTLSFPPLVKPGLKRDQLVICQDI